MIHQEISDLPHHLLLFANVLAIHYFLPSNIVATCGNGVVDAGEQCDSGAGCDSNCRCISGTPQRIGFQPFSPPLPSCRRKNFA